MSGTDGLPVAGYGGLPAVTPADGTPTGGGDVTAGATPKRKPGFSGAAGNAC